MTLATPAPEHVTTPREGWTSPRVVGTALGVVYLAVGVVGALLTGWDHLTSMHGRTLLVFQINPMHNLAHLGLGAALVVGSLLGAETARGTNRLVGVVFLLLGLVGPFLMGMEVSQYALNSWDHVLHLGTAAVLLGYSWLGRRRAPRAA